jgi:hypothetical protein
MPARTPRPPEDPGRPTPREAIARARAEAGPRVAKAMESAAPKVEKAAVRAGRLLGTLRERAKNTASDTARGFSEGYGGADEQAPEGGSTGRPPTPRRRPKPGPR